MLIIVFSLFAIMFCTLQKSNIECISCKMALLIWRSLRFFFCLISVVWMQDLSANWACIDVYVSFSRCYNIVKKHLSNNSFLSNIFTLKIFFLAFTVYSFWKQSTERNNWSLQPIPTSLCRSMILKNENIKKALNCSRKRSFLIVTSTF